MKKSIFLYLAPLFVLYLVVILVLANTDFRGDEQVYVNYAQNLAQGFYSPRDNPQVTCGPGYPLFLTPFVLLGIPLIIPKLFNAVFLIGGIYFFYRTLRLHDITRGKALFGTYLLGLYPPLIRWSFTLHTEPFSFLSMCGFVYYASIFLRQKKINYKDYLPAVLCFAGLIYIKVYFHFVMQASLGLLLITSIFLRNRKNLMAIALLGGGYLLFAPFLVYMYFLTEKPLYTGTHGGEIMYHRSTPFPHEFGNYFSDYDINGGELKGDREMVYNNLDQLVENHKAFYNEIAPLSFIQRDSAFKKKAKENMIQYPGKYLKNTVANASRLFFHFPFSYRSESLLPLGYLIPNIFIVVFVVVCLYPAFIGRKRIPYDLLVLTIFIFIYLGGMILLLGKGRNFILAVPILLLFIFFVINNILQIQIRKQP